MFRRWGVLLTGMALLACCLGCNTVYKSTKGAAQGAVEGAQQDYQEAKKADAWMQKNLW